jgi:hypothetical protein
MKIIFLFFLFISFSAHSEDKICSTQKLDILQKIERDLISCKIDMPENPSTADMNNATYNATDCLIALAHRIFEEYYIQDKIQVTEDFDRFVKEIHINSHNLIQRSDAAKNFYNGTMYNTMAINDAYLTIKNVVQQYIKQIKEECRDIYK